MGVATFCTEKEKCINSPILIEFESPGWGRRTNCYVCLD